MKLPSRFILLLFLCGLLIATPSLIVHAASFGQELSYNPEAEEYIRSALLENGNADLALNFISREERTVRGEFIASLWKDPELAGIPTFRLSNATITGNIEAEGITIPFNVGFTNCVFNGRLNLDSANTKTFRIDNSIVNGSVRMGRMHVEGDLALYTSVFSGEMTLFDARIDSNLFARGSQFRATRPDPTSRAPFELWKTQVGQTTEFTDSVIKGEVIAESAIFGVDARFNGVTFEGPTSFKDAEVGVLANFQYAVFKRPVTFESSQIQRDIQFTGSRFEDTSTFNYITVERFLDFDNAFVLQDFSIQYPNIGWPNFAGTTFRGAVDFEGMQTDNDFDFTNAIYDFEGEPFTIFLARVDGQVLFNGFVSDAGMDLSHNSFGDLEITSTRRAKFQQLKLDSSVIQGDLILDNIEIDSMSAKELEVEEKTRFTRLAIHQELNLSNASLGFFTVDEDGFWPRPSNGKPNSNLRGLTFNDIGLVELSARPTSEGQLQESTTEFVDRELGETTWDVLLRMVNESEYSPQAYRTLSEFLTEKGHPEWAATVEFNRQNRERKEILPAGTAAWFWSWFNLFFSGYGQIPALAFIWSALVITIGAIFYWHESDLIVVDDHESKPIYNPFLYSFALFVPFIELDFAEKWEPRPERRVAWIYKYVLKILGWILTPIALLTFGGVLG